MEKKNLAAEAANAYNEKVFADLIKSAKTLASTLPKTEEMTVTIRPRRIVETFQGVVAAIAAHAANSKILDGEGLRQDATVEDVATWVKTQVAPVFIDGVVGIYASILDVVVDDVEKPIAEMLLSGEKLSRLVSIDDHVVVK